MIVNIFPLARQDVLEQFMYFNGLGVYRVGESEIQIIRVLHEKRNVGVILGLDDLLMDGLRGPAQEVTEKFLYELQVKIHQGLTKS